MGDVLTSLIIADIERKERVHGALIQIHNELEAVLLTLPFVSNEVCVNKVLVARDAIGEAFPMLRAEIDALYEAKHKLSDYHGGE